MEVVRFVNRIVVALLLLPALAWAQLHTSAKPRPSEPLDYETVVSNISIGDMRAAIKESWKHGLNPKLYWTDSLESKYSKGANVRAAANQAYLRMLNHLYGGSVNPQFVGYDVKFVKKDFLSPKQLRAIVLATGNDAKSLVDEVAPQNAPYQSVRQGFVKIYPACTDGTWSEIVPVNTSLRLYSKNPVISQIKKRLAILGYKMSNSDDVFDGDLLNAITDIQWNLRIKPDGEISPKGKVWQFLSVPCQERVRQLQVDMEKMRWFPQYFEDRYIFVNLAMSYFILMDTSNPDYHRVMSFRTVNGRPSRKSPTMRDLIVKVILNPYWTVPPTIFSEDKVNDLKVLTKAQIREYFDSHHYEVWSGDWKRRIDPTSIDWMALSEGRVSYDISIRQLPHLGNALGVVKFDLTNGFLIYLHDTNQRELFDVPMRQLSSGCMRLEKPFDLAEYLLEDTAWDRKTIESMVARPGEVLSKSTEIPVPKAKQTPVYTAYLTSMMSSDGVVRFVDDIYGQNTAIKTYLSPLFVGEESSQYWGLN
ncbi:amidase [Bdellovibrio sp. ZAP7]|uniref:L,D-transpeptidase family protein n=1 Tax=Bdellovibrio sp. ZAP7 TaxID=2231053 RepID=UPI00115C0C68|nr:L,D-transpeptidase family protein [Bdellovibrio sp. ZAP7]QDK43928.1 amidase [Bdellovibrio sp. ZAP7]